MHIIAHLGGRDVVQDEVLVDVPRFTHFDSFRRGSSGDVEKGLRIEDSTIDTRKRNNPRMEMGICLMDKKDASK